MGDSVIPSPAISGRARRNSVDDYVNGAQRGAPAPAPQPAPPANVHPGVLQAITQGISSLFGGGGAAPAAPPAAMSAGGAVTPIGVPDMDVGSTALPYEPATVRASGGKMPLAAHNHIDQNPPGKVLSMARGGSVSDYMGNTHYDPQAQAQAGALLYKTGEDMKQRRLDDTAHQTAADAIPTFAQQPEKELHDAVHEYGEHLEQGALNDAGTQAGAAALPAPEAVATGIAPPDAASAGSQGAAPSGAAGAPAIPAGPATDGEPPSAGDQAAVAAVTSAAADPNAKAGIPQESQQQSAKPHSLTHDWWDESNTKMMKAVQAATRAGKDPKATMDAMVAVRNGFFQANIMKNLSAANVALLSGDNEAVSKALKNVYYYFPDGKELDIKKGPNGEVMYQDPIHPYIDTAGNPTDVAKFHDKDNKPNMVPVTPEHLQLLAQGAMDPLKVGDIIASRRAAGAKAATDRMEAEAKVRAARGAELTGEANWGKVASTNVKNLADAQLAQARAVTSGWVLQRLALLAKNQKLDPTVLRGAQAAAAALDDMFLGNKTSVAVTDKEGNPSLSPAAGKVVHDPATVQEAFKNATPIDVAYSKGLASSVYAANAKGGMQPAQAAEIAARFHMSKGKTHKGASGKDEPDAWIHAEGGSAGLWNPATKKYDQFRIDPVAAQDLASGPTASELTAIAVSMGSGGTGAIPSPSESATPDAEQ